MQSNGKAVCVFLLVFCSAFALSACESQETPIAGASKPAAPTPQKVPDGTFIGANEMLRLCDRNAVACADETGMVIKAAKTETDPADGSTTKRCIAAESLDANRLTMAYLRSHDVSKMRAIDAVRAALDEEKITLCP